MTVTEPITPSPSKRVRRPKRNLIQWVGAGAAGALLLTGGAVALANYKTVSISVDGANQSISTFSGDVSGALAAAGVTVGEHDLVVPAPSAALTSGTTITVKRATPITLGDATVWTTEGTVAAAAAAKGGMDGFSASRAVLREEIAALPLVAAGDKVTVVADGKETQIVASGELDIEGVLKQAGIEVSPIDHVKSAISADGAVTVTVVRVVRAVTNTESEIAFETVEERTDDLYEDESEVTQEGTPGKMVTHTYTETRDGKTVVSAKTGETVTVQPAKKIVRVGTKERPAVRQQASGGGSSVEAVASTVGGDVWAALAQCESGGNPATNTGNGYYGLYQFSLPTWYSVGGTGLPSEASAAEQTMRAQILQQRAGWGQWPACTSMLGLR